MSRYMLIVFIAVLIAGTMAYSLIKADDIAEKYAPLIDATMEIKFEITNTHLKTEELIEEFRFIQPTAVFGHIETAKWYAHAMLSGGTSAEGVFVPLTSPELRKSVQNTLSGIKLFETLVRQRLSLKPDSGEHEKIAAQMHDTYNNLIQEIDKVETLLQKQIASDLTLFHTGQKLMIAVVVVLAGAIGFIQFRYDRERTRVMAETEQARRKAEDNESRLRTIMKSMGDALIVTDTLGRIEYMNPVASSLTGWSAEEARMRRINEVFHIVNELTGKPAENPVEKVIREHAVVGLANHTVLIAKDGRRFPIADSGAPILDSQKELKGVVLVFHDITDRKRAEEELRQTRNYLRNIVDSMPSTLVGVDSNSKITHWNRSAEMATGLSYDEAHGRPFEHVFPALKHQGEKVRSSIINRQIARAERVAQDAHGETRFADVMIYPLVTNGVEGAVIRIDDITERVRLENMMVQTEKMMSVGGLAAGMAHEINNPLGAIMQGAQNIQRRLSGDLPANRQAAEACGIDLDRLQQFLEKREILKFLDGIRESGHRASVIVSNMLQFSRRSDERMTLADLSELLDRTVELASNDYDLKKKYDFRHIEIVRDLSSDIGQVQCIATEIEQVVLNLLKNAAYEMFSAGTESPRLALRTRKEGDMAVVEVQDNGPGMPEEIRKRVFEPFFTTKPVGVGTGLGLSVSYFIITENHGGTIDVESSPGAGACFIIRLPLRRA